MLSYREMAPPQALEDLVECAWSWSGILPAGVVQRSRVLPDGCMDIIFDLGPEAGTADARGFVVGTMTRAEVFDAARRLDVLGVRFRPGGAPRVLGTPAHELTDGSAVLSNWVGAAARVTVERLADARDFAERTRILWRFIADQVAGGARRVHLIRAADVLMHAHRGISVAGIADRIGVSTRTVERAFVEQIGISPKLSARIARFRRAVTFLHDHPRVTLSQTAHACGYFDQSHFNREFRALAGLSPREWRAERDAVASIQAAEPATE